MPPCTPASVTLLSLFVACSADEPDRATVADALPAVVLVVTDRPDGTVGWGSGLIVGDGGLVLTNKHVVDESVSLRAMLHDDARPSYTPMDGGLSRYLFENERDLVPAVVLRSDTVLDLALVRIDADTSQLPHLEFAHELPGIGDRVFALGHPQETVWTFTSGVVSAIHQGAIQHDAPVSAGSSGGPLLDASGRVVGINTSKVLSDAEGLAFARPIALADRVLDASTEQATIDLSTPENAARACMHAAELGSITVLDCMDWEHRWQIFQKSVGDLDSAGIFPDGSAKRTVDDLGGRAFWVSRMQEVDLSHYRPDDREQWQFRELMHPVPDAVLDRHDLDPVVFHQQRRGLWTSAIALSEAARERFKVDNGLREPEKKEGALQDLLRQGSRVERSHTIGGNRAWVEMAGRNPDGSPLTWSEFYVLDSKSWRQQDPVIAQDMATLPEGWAPPFSDEAAWRSVVSAQMLFWVAWQLATDDERSVARELPRPIRHDGLPWETQATAQEIPPTDGQNSADSSGLIEGAGG